MEKKYKGIVSQRSGSNVVANPTLEGNEDNLNSITINGVNYKVGGSGGGSKVSVNDYNEDNPQTLDTITIDDEEYSVSGVVTINSTDIFEEEDDNERLVRFHLNFDNTNRVIDFSKRFIVVFGVNNHRYKMYFEQDTAPFMVTEIKSDGEIVIADTDYQSGDLVYGVSLWQKEECVVMLNAETLHDILGGQLTKIDYAYITGYKQNQLTDIFYALEN